MAERRARALIQPEVKELVEERAIRSTVPVAKSHAPRGTSLSLCPIWECSMPLPFLNSRQATPLTGHGVNLYHVRIVPELQAPAGDLQLGLG
jgi:hypothetical protein